MLSLKPDFEITQQRIEAFWECELLDRPVVQFGLARPPDDQMPLPESQHTSPRERWLDAEYQAAYHLAVLSNQEFLGDTLPVAFPNLGPEVFAAFYGCRLHFGDYGTSWTEPILHDWSDADAVELDPDNYYVHKLHELTDTFLAVGQDTFITGMTDWHPGGDWLAAIRDPASLAMDLITHPEEVKALLDRAEQDYFRIYDVFYAKLRAAGQPISTWLPLVSDGKYYVPSNDFSYMISNQMFEEIFLPGIARECRFLDRSIYHLDGPGALRHLDSLLAIPALNAVQWVFGAGNEGFDRWVDVYRRIQAAGKGVEVICTFDELDAVMETLSPGGLYLSVGGVPDREAGLAMLDRLAHWSAGQSWRGLHFRDPDTLAS